MTVSPMAVSQRDLETINALALLGIGLVLAAAYAFQLALDELPCPLCLLQRVAFAAIAFGFLLNLRYGIRASHYGIVVLAALFGMAVSGRQVLQHIVPGTGAYGSAFLGLHFYSWAFVLFAATVLATACLLLVQPRNGGEGAAPGILPRLAIILAIALTLANAATTFVECGPVECVDNPVRYWLFDKAT
jgi:disulfide bond formation protein DsbB